MAATMTFNSAPPGQRVIPGTVLAGPDHAPLSPQERTARDEEE
jgi:hypothetical protein